LPPPFYNNQVSLNVRSDVASKPGREMIYRVSYDVGLRTAPENGRELDAVKVEEFSTEYEAFGRARELLEDGDHGRVSVRDVSGNVLCGVRLQLKLGFFGE
jgi:hypothetical protein